MGSKQAEIATNLAGINQLIIMDTEKVSEQDTPGNKMGSLTRLISSVALQPSISSLNRNNLIPSLSEIRID